MNLLLNTHSVHVKLVGYNGKIRIVAGLCPCLKRTLFTQFSAIPVLNRFGKFNMPISNLLFGTITTSIIHRFEILLFGTT